MQKVLQRGFTLIELLVVIAIIGILAAVVLASLNDARQSGSDASIQQSLGNARSQAEIVYNRDGAFSYDQVCADEQIQQLLVAAGDASGVGTTSNSTDISPSGDGAATCNDSANTWAIAAPLASTSSVAWCVDSAGEVGRVQAASAIAGSDGNDNWACGN